MNNEATIISGPCSINEHNMDQTRRIAEMPGIAAVRNVGLKSRTRLDPSGNGMGMDYEIFEKNKQILQSGGTIDDFIVPPTVRFAAELCKETGVGIATEIMDPHIQLPVLSGLIPHGKLLAWLPSVNQLGWTVSAMGLYTASRGNTVLIKNGKWTAATLEDSRSGTTPYEQTWEGLATFVPNGGKTVLIHRGFDIPGKGDYRNIPIHEIAMRVKQNTELPMFFDPSHAYGPKLRDEIVSGTVSAMQMKMSDGTFLYDGMLVEAGDSLTDTKQHITLLELDELVDRIGQFRDLTEL